MFGAFEAVRRCHCPDPRSRKHKSRHRVKQLAVPSGLIRRGCFFHFTSLMSIFYVKGFKSMFTRFARERWSISKLKKPYGERLIFLLPDLPRLLLLMSHDRKLNQLRIILVNFS